MFRSLMTIIRELYLYLTKVLHVVEQHAALRHVTTSPNIYIYIYIYIKT